MQRFLLLLCLLLSTMTIQAADLMNGEEINRSCAMCHGQYGQGAPGPHAPRMAGVDKDYLFRATKEYRDDHRDEITMAYATGLKLMSDKDIKDVSAYLSQLEIPPEALFDVKTDKGDPTIGKKLFKDCKTCHGTDGMGKAKKKAPRLAGQFTGWLALSIEQFRQRQRKHGTDKDDQTLFDDFSSEEIEHILAYAATFDDAEYLAVTKGLVKTAPSENVSQTLDSPLEPAKLSANPSNKKPDAAGLKITDIKQFM